MPSNKYWTQRAEERAQRLYDKADNSYSDLKQLFAKSSRKMENEVSAFYNKYGTVKLSPKFNAQGIAIPNGETAKLSVTYVNAQKYKRLDSLTKQLDVILSELAREQNKYMTTELRLLANEAYNSFYFDTFQGYGVGYNFDLLDPKLVTELIKNPVNGQDFKAREWTNKNLLANQVNQELKNGLIQGISTRDMSKRLASKMNSGYMVAERLMRTEITNTYNQATLQGYKDSGIVKEYIFLATLDDRTSDYCIKWDNKTVLVKDAVTGINLPPLHVNCRSTTISKFDDEVFERRARDSKGNTYTVPSDMTYKEWKDGTYNPKKVNKHKELSFKQKKPNRQMFKQYERGTEQYDTAREAYKKQLALYDKNIGEFANTVVSRVNAIDNIGDLTDWANKKSIPIIGNVDGMDLKTFNDIIPAFDDMYEKYPDLALTVNKIKFENVGMEYIAEASGGVNYNKDLLGSYSDFIKRNADNYTVGDTIYNTTVHELGHNIDHLLGAEKGVFDIVDDIAEISVNFDIRKSVKYEFNEKIRNYRIKNNFDTEWIEENVSEYAVTNTSELFAELFSQYHSKSYSSELSDYFGKELDKVMSNSNEWLDKKALKLIKKEVTQ